MTNQNLAEPLIDGRHSSRHTQQAVAASAIDGGEVRPLAKEDLPAVAAVYNRVFLKSPHPPSSTLLSHLESQFLPSGGKSGSLVYVRDGTVAGFVGSLPMTMIIEGREAKVAVLTSLMVDNHEGDPMGGAKLIRAMVSGPQDITISETASRTSVAMWRSLRGAVLPGYSLDWLKILSPVGYVVARLARGSSIARVAAPVTLAIDRIIAHHPVGPQHWRPYVAKAMKSVTSHDVSVHEAARIISDLATGYDARPLWDGDRLERRLEAASVKSLLGPLTLRAVQGRGPKPAGIFMFHGPKHAVGHVLQVLARPGQAGLVLDEMFRHAASIGLVALRGRADPTLLDAMIGRDCSLTNTATTVAIARDQTLLETMIAGRAFITGLAGENWSPLVGNDLTR